MKNLPTVFLLLLISGLLLSCEEADKSKVETVPSFSHVVKFPTEYYIGGPQQARPPDGTFNAGTEVNVLEDAGSYLLVESKDGIKAFVSISALEPQG